MGSWLAPRVMNLCGLSAARRPASKPPRIPPRLQVYCTAPIRRAGRQKPGPPALQKRRRASALATARSGRLCIHRTAAFALVQPTRRALHSGNAYLFVPRVHAADNSSMIFGLLPADCTHVGPSIGVAISFILVARLSENSVRSFLDAGFFYRLPRPEHSDQPLVAPANALFLCRASPMAIYENGRHRSCRRSFPL